MPVEIIMPKWGHTMEEGTITRWLKKEGDRVEKGEELFEVETEKITNVVEAAGAGILFQILVPAGSTAAVGAVVAVLAEPGTEPERRLEGIEPVPPQVEKGAEAESLRPAAAVVQEPGGFVRATPAARRLAKEMGIDLAGLAGTGPEGRITEKDVSCIRPGAASSKATPLASEMARQAGVDLSSVTGTGEGGKIIAGDVEQVLARHASRPVRSIPFSGMRKAIGQNMHASLMNTAQLTAFTEVDATETVRFRDLARKEIQPDQTRKISFTDIFILAAARALKRFPIMNSTLMGEEILLHEFVHMGIAVALPDGLIVPVLKDADRKGLFQIAEESRELARRARAGRLSVDEVTGGTFTVTNLSMFGVDGITPILRPPETGILGFGRIREKPAVFNGEITARWMTTVCLTFDHRVVDGAPAGQFLQTVARFIEQPSLILT